MANWLNRVLRTDKKDTELGRSDPTNLLSTLDSARETSLHPDNYNDVIVVVDMGAVVDAATGPYVRQRFNFYTYRGNGNYNKLPHLKAAYVNGMRVDTLDADMGGRVGDVTLPAKTGEVTIDADDPLALGGRKAVAEPEEPSLATMATLDLPTRTYARDRKPEPEEEEEAVVEEPHPDEPTLATIATLDLPTRTYARDRKLEVEDEVEELEEVQTPVEGERTLATMDAGDFETHAVPTDAEIVYSAGPLSEVTDEPEDEGPTLATIDVEDLPQWSRAEAAPEHAEAAHSAP